MPTYNNSTMELLKGFQGSKNDLQTWCKFHLIFMTSYFMLPLWSYLQFRFFSNLNQTYCWDNMKSMWYLRHNQYLSHENNNKKKYEIFHFLQFGPKFKMAVIPSFWGVGIQHCKRFFHFSLRDLTYLKSNWFHDGHYHRPPKLPLSYPISCCNLLL